MNPYRYFQAYLHYFWQWEDQGTVLSIPNGDTIAYRELAIEVLEHLSPQGIPQFGNVLLALIATNPSAEKNIKKTKAIIQSSIFPDRKHGNVGGSFEATIRFLNTLSQLPQHLKTGKGRLLLFQTIFDRTHNLLSERKNKPVIHFLKTKRLDHHQLSLQKKIESKQMLSEIRIFQTLHSRYPTVQSILDAIQNLPDCEKLTDEFFDLEKTTEQAETYEHFVDELAAQPKTFHVGSLIRHLWSGLDIPYHHSSPSRQPLGGVSDISNKGDYAHLLISEFANEDVIFLSRLANNEALFLNREVPLQSDSMERIILIDASLKSWGTPKLLAHAVALAVAHHPKSTMSCQLYALGQSFYPLEYNTVDGVINSLQQLDACLNPAKGLEHFFKAKPKIGTHEILFIGAKHSFVQPILKQELDKHKSSLNFLIQTDDEGQINVYKRTSNDKKHIQHLTLPLENLWMKKPKKIANKVESTNFRKFPILFPSVSHPKHPIYLNEELVFQITNKTVLQLDGNVSQIREKGWKIIREALPFKGLHEIGCFSNGDHILLMFNRQDRQIVWINLTTGEKQQVVFDDWRSSSTPYIFFSNDAFHYLNYNIHWVITANPQLRISQQDSSKEIKDVYLKRQEENIKFKQNTWMDYSILKNIKTVFINQRNNLVFNSHELRCTMRGIRLEIQREQLRTSSATQTGRNEFTFPNGNKVSINRLGMIVLDDNKKTDKYLLMLKKVNESKLLLIKNLRLKTSINLSTIQQLVSHTPSIIASDISMSEAQQLKKKLLQGNIDADMEIVPYQSNTIYIPSVLERTLGVATNRYFAGNDYFLPSAEKSLARLSPADFYERHIRSFINEAKHETKA